MALGTIELLHGRLVEELCPEIDSFGNDPIDKARMPVVALPPVRIAPVVRSQIPAAHDSYAYDLT